MLITAVCCLAFVRQQQTTPPDDNPFARPTFLGIYKAHTVYLNGATNDPSQIQGQSVRYEEIGLCNWSITDGGYHGIPCHRYIGDGKWDYKVSKRNTAIIDYHTAKYTMEYDVGLDGVPIHSESHFSDTSEETSKTIDLVADYKEHEIDETLTTDGVPQSAQLFPNFEMTKFSNMFKPMMSMGLIKNPSMDCVVLHPYTGKPYFFKLDVTAHFNGEYFFLPQEGYAIKTTGPEGDTVTYLSRQGQILEMDLGNQTSADLEIGPSGEERSNWKSFNLSDWNKPTDETNPERPTYHSLAIPVVFDHPKMLFPVPCALTD